MSLGKREKRSEDMENGGKTKKRKSVGSKLAAIPSHTRNQPDEEQEQKRAKTPKSQKRKQLNHPPVDTVHNDSGSATSTTYKYAETEALAGVPDEEITAFLSSQQVSVADPSAPVSSTWLRPILKFEHLPRSALLSKRPFGSFRAPTPIQSASWPYLLSGRDMIGVAETGSGKTLAFAVPCAELLFSSPKPATTTTSNVALIRALVVSPTRELAIQTHTTMSSLAASIGLSAVCLYGGSNKYEQRAQLLQNPGADIVVATPGRLKDFLTEGSLSLEHARFVVLDEADRMLDKGFEDDIQFILGKCVEKAQRQTVMFTATWPKSVQGLAAGYMKSPVRITVGGAGSSDTRAGGEQDSPAQNNGNSELQANRRISQQVELVDPWQKEQRLLQLLKAEQQGGRKFDRILVFCLYKKEVVRVERFLTERGLRVVSIHGDLRQEQRTRSLQAFKDGKVSILVATDVAARGLDIPDVKLVINLTFPLTIEDYVHRIGRTGRAGQAGRALTLFTEHDKAHSGSLINILKGANQPVPKELLKFGASVKKKTHETYGAFFKDVDMSQKGTKITFD